MREISKSEFHRLTRAELEALKPIIVTYDGVEVGVFCSRDKVIVIEDLHPRVQLQLRARERQARAGMPKPEKIYLDDVMPKRAE